MLLYKLFKKLFNKLGVNMKLRKYLPVSTAFLIFIVLSLFLYIQLQSAISRTLSHVSDDFVVQVERMVERINDKIRVSAVQLFYTSSIRQLRTMNLYDISQSTVGQLDLEHFVSSTNFIDTVMVHNRNLNLFFTSNGRFSYSFDGFYGFYDRSAVELLSKFEYYPNLSPIKRFVGDELYYSFLFLERGGAQSGALLLNINAYMYASNLLESFAIGNSIIINEQGQLIAFHDARLANQVLRTWPEFEMWMQANPYVPFITFFPFFRDGEVWLYHYLEEFGLYYINIMRLSDAAPGIVYMFNFFLVGAALFGTLFFLAMLYILLRGFFLYKRIQDVICSSGEPSGDSLKLREIFERKKEIEYAKKIKAMREGSLQSDFSCPILLIQADRPFGSFCRELTDIYPDAMVADDSAGAIAAIPCSTAERFDEIYQCFFGKINAPLYFSKLCQSAQHLQSSFTALDELRKLRFLYTDRQVMREELLDECNSVSMLNTKNVSTLVSFLREGQFEPAIKEWHCIFEDIRTDRFAGLCFAMQYIEKQLDALCSEFELSRTALCDYIFGKAQDVLLLHSYMEDLFSKITQSASSRKWEQREALAQKVDKYICEHYVEESLSAQQIADYFKISPAYLSQQFRKAKNMSISDAIHYVRVEKACRYLINTNDSVELIAKKSGYSNTKYFFVVFKKIEGITPSQYRKQIQV